MVLGSERATHKEDFDRQKASQYQSLKQRELGLRPLTGNMEQALVLGTAE